MPNAEAKILEVISVHVFTAQYDVMNNWEWNEGVNVNAHFIS
jgi:hypothetical protein